MSFTTPLPDGARQINKLYTFHTVLKVLPDPSEKLGDIIRQFDLAVKTEYPSVTTGALNNAHGDWFEWLLSIAAWNTHIKYDTPYLAFCLPNINQFDCAKLYNQELYLMIQHLREEVTRSSNVQLISSNPDFVILSASVGKDIGLKDIIAEVTEEALLKLDMAYLQYLHACDFDAIQGYLAAKLSFRPDRRLQIPHEGSLVKALYVHLQTRQWITEPRGIKYYAMAASVSQSDKNALRTVATHSITTVSSKPQSAVDEVFEISTWQKAEEAFLSTHVTQSTDPGTESTRLMNGRPTDARNAIMRVPPALRAAPNARPCPRRSAPPPILGGRAGILGFLFNMYY